MKRFYEAATATDEGRILLDGRPVKTPSRADLAAPTPELAAAIEREPPVRPSLLRGDLPAELEQLILALLAKQRGVYRGRKKALSPERGAELRRRATAGEQKAKLAREFGISRSERQQIRLFFGDSLHHSPKEEGSLISQTESVSTQA